MVEWGRGEDPVSRTLDRTPTTGRRSGPRPPVAVTVAGLVAQAVAWFYVVVFFVDPDPAREPGSEGAFNALSGTVPFGIVAGLLLGIAALRCAVMRRSDGRRPPESLELVYAVNLMGLTGVVVMFLVAAVASAVF